MNDRRPSIYCFVFSVLLSSTLASAQQPASSGPAPIPPAIPSAGAIFVSNAGSDSGLFPEPFSGDPNRPYNQLYAELKKSSQLRLVTSPSEADLILELRLTAPYGPTNANKQNGAADPLPMFRLTIYDQKTHYILWTVTESIEFAFLQKTHDRNFDAALDRAVNTFLQLAGKLPVAPATTP